MTLGYHGPAGAPTLRFPQSGGLRSSLFASPSGWGPPFAFERTCDSLVSNDERSTEAMHMDESRCCIVECGEDNYCRSFCQKHYTRWLRHGHPLYAPKRIYRTVQERLVAYRRVTENGCWEWTGWCTKYGYGTMQLDGKNQRVHRVSYEFYVGTIPEGLTLDHLCRNPPCFRPEYLEPVTASENAIRAARDRELERRAAGGTA